MGAQRDAATEAAAYSVPASPGRVGSLVWAWAYQTEFGFNFFLRSLGLPAIPWLSSSAWSMPSVIIWSIWASVGYPIILYLAALQAVPPEIVEAAKLDGAASWQTSGSSPGRRSLRRRSSSSSCSSSAPFRSSARCTGAPGGPDRRRAARLHAR
jgi:hypothetical protein